AFAESSSGEHIKVLVASADSEDKWRTGRAHPR
ncbi:MAG: hypothetical protein QOI16_3203, partial [Pseudonocardiales bacterium]|nr:hypothetical protein [Pseudonocardiales bacterium]